MCAKRLLQFMKGDFGLIRWVRLDVSDRFLCRTRSRQRPHGLVGVQIKRYGAYEKTE